jgi:hypothetical protein
MIFAEPFSAWEARKNAPARQCLDLLNSPLRFESVWDYAIIEEVQNLARPTPIMTLLNQLRKRHRHRNKRDKEGIKRTILLRIGALVRQKELYRVGRKFVVLPSVR